MTAQTHIRAVARIASRAVRIEPFEGSRWRLRRIRSGYGNSIDFHLQQIDGEQVSKKRRKSIDDVPAAHNVRVSHA